MMDMKVSHYLDVTFKFGNLLEECINAAVLS